MNGGRTPSTLGRPWRQGRSLRRVRQWGALGTAGLAAALASPRGLVSPVAATPSIAPSCDPVSEHDVVGPLAHLDSGEYALTVVASSGASAGAWVKGRLWLRRVRSLDTSSVAVERALAAGADRTPLYGAVNIDFGGVGTPVLAADGRAPDPRSFDPIRPGVLVVRQADTARGDATWQVLVATTANDRGVPCQAGVPCPALPSDGPGVVLTVRKLAPDAFAGGWRPAASGGTQRGYFCAARVRYYPYTVRRHIP
jgi:hypothetical protein